MSRSGYSDDGDCENWSLICWRGAVTSAIRGARGQAFLRELVAALDAMPVKELAAESLVTEDGEFCTLGAVGASRGMDMSSIDPEDWGQVAKAFGLAPAMVREIVYENDEGTVSDWKWVDVEICGPMRRPENHKRSRMVADPTAGARRWHAMRSWAEKNLKKQIEATP